MAEVLANGATGLHAWLLVTSALFSVGIYGLLTRRNAVGILLSLELCLNAAAVQFAVFNALRAPVRVDGAVMALFVVAVAAAEVVVGMAIFVLLYSQRRTVDVTELTGDGPSSVPLEPGCGQACTPARQTQDHSAPPTTLAVGGTP